MKPNSSSVTWRGVDERGVGGRGGVDPGRGVRGSTSRATVTTVSPGGSSSACSACHPGRLVRQPHQLAQATSSTLRPAQRRQPERVAVAVDAASGSAATAVVSACPPAAGPRAHRPCASSCTNGMPSRSATTCDVERPSSRRAPGRRHADLALAQALGLGLPAGPVGEGGGVDIEGLEQHAPDRTLSFVRAWEVAAPGPIDTRPVVLGARAIPEPGPGEVRVRVRCAACAAPTCTSPRATWRRGGPASSPGHEVVGVVDALGAGATRFAVGRAGRRGLAAAHLRHAAGSAAAGDENLCLAPRFTGWDDDGGYAEYAVVDERVRLPLPDGVSTTSTRRRCCAPGIIGYRALRRPRLPPGGRLGIYGFGGSAHLTAQVALRRGMRGARAHPGRAQPRAGRASSAATRSVTADDRPPEPLDARHPVRPGRRPGAGGAAGARPGRDAGRRGHPPVATCRRCDYAGRAVPGAGAAQRHGQHARRRRGRSCALAAAPSASARPPSRTRSTAADRRARRPRRRRVSGAAVLHVAGG